MRKVLFTAVLGGSLLVAGCNTTGGNGGGGLIGFLPEHLQGAILGACRVFVGLNDINKILTTLVPGSDTVAAVAQSICATLQLTAGPSVRAAGAVQTVRGNFRGVVITGIVR